MVKKWLETKEIAVLTQRASAPFAKLLACLDKNQLIYLVQF